MSPAPALLTPAVVMFLKSFSCAARAEARHPCAFRARLRREHPRAQRDQRAGLMVTVAMSVSVGGWLSSVEKSIVDWFDQVVASDLTVTRGSPCLDRRHLQMNDDVFRSSPMSSGVIGLQPVRIFEQHWSHGHSSDRGHRY